MKIHNYFYNEDTTVLNIDFSTNEDGDNFYRNFSLTIDEINYNSTYHVYIDDFLDADDETLIDFINYYYENNVLPEHIIL